MELSKNPIIKSKISTRFLKILLLLFLALLIYGTNNTSIYYANLTPFGIALTFSLFYIGFNGYILGLLFFLATLLSGIGVSNIVTGASVVVVLFVLQYLDDKNRLKKNKIIILISWILSLVGYIAMGIGDGKAILAMIVSIVLGVLYLFSSLIYLESTILKGMLGKTNIDEKICGGVILIVFGIGISRACISIVSVGLLIGYFVILGVSYLFSLGASMCVSALLGIGFSLGYNDPTYISMFILVSLVVYAFKCRYRIVSILAGILIYIGYNILFGLGMSLGGVLGLAIGGLLYLLLPSKLLVGVFTQMHGSRGVILQDVFTSSKKYLIARVKELGKVFAQMDEVYRQMVRGNLGDDDAKKMIREELISGVCSKCPNESMCYRTSGSFMENCMEMLVGVGYEKGKLLLIDLPEYLATNCIRSSVVLQYANNLIVSYNEYKNSISNLDASRLLIADQLSGVSRLLESLSKEVDITINFSNKYSAIVSENLGYVGIVCIECVVYEKINDTTISIIVKNNNIDDKKIEDTVSRSLTGKFGIVSKVDGELPDTLSIVLKNLPRYNIAFGSARATKSGKAYSGDSYRIVDIGDGKYMLSICDGMGSGKSACKLSGLTISLIENFYRAGFDNDIILGSVNKLLSITEEEKFSTIDLCMVDCKKGIYDFIKLGATSGYIIHDDGTIDEIASSGLPVGVLEDIRPHITKKMITSMDMVVLMSDGVSDVIGDRMASIIRSIDTINPQTLSDRLLSIALDESGGVARDDMTIIAIRVFENV